LHDGKLDFGTTNLITKMQGMLRQIYLQININSAQSRYCAARMKGSSFFTQCIVDRAHQDRLDFAFWNSSCVAEEFGVLQSADTPPDNRLLTTVVPVNTAKVLAACFW